MVRVGDGAVVLGIREWQAARRDDTSGEHLGDGLSAQRPRKVSFHHRIRVLRTPIEQPRSPRYDDEDDRLRSDTPKVGYILKEESAIINKKIDGR
jgi:hypothetical protein